MQPPSSDASLPESERMRQLAEALAYMRDSLVGLSLTLQDYQFEQDTQQRAQAASLVQGMLDALGQSRH